MPSRWKGWLWLAAALVAATLAAGTAGAAPKPVRAHDGGAAAAYQPDRQGLTRTSAGTWQTVGEVA